VVIVWRDLDYVYDRQTVGHDLLVVKGFGIHVRLVAAEETGTGSDRLGPKTGSGSIGGSAVKRDIQNRNFELSDLAVDRADYAVCPAEFVGVHTPRLPIDR
jgi:hypothetical protein